MFRCNCLLCMVALACLTFAASLGASGSLKANEQTVTSSAGYQMSACNLRSASSWGISAATQSGNRKHYSGHNTSTYRAIMKAGDSSGMASFDSANSSVAQVSTSYSNAVGSSHTFTGWGQSRNVWIGTNANADDHFNWSAGVPGNVTTAATAGDRLNAHYVDVRRTDNHDPVLSTDTSNVAAGFGVKADALLVRAGASLTLSAGAVFDLAGPDNPANQSGQVTIKGTATLNVGAGSQLRLGDNAALKVRGDGLLNVTGVPGVPATISRSEAVGYHITLDDGARLEGRNFVMQGFSATASYDLNGGSVHIDLEQGQFADANTRNDLSGGLAASFFFDFTRLASGAVNLNNAIWNQTPTIPPATAIYNIVADSNTPFMCIMGSDGPLAPLATGGEDYDYDPGTSGDPFQASQGRVDWGMCVNAPGLSIAATGNGNEAGTVAATFVVTADHPAAQAMHVRYDTENGGGVGGAYAGYDYVGVASGLLQFDAGELTKDISVSVLDDALWEDGESLGVRLSNPVGATLTTALATAGIADNDAMPALTFAGPVNVGEAAGSATFVAVLGMPIGRALSFEAQAVEISDPLNNAGALSGVDFDGSLQLLVISLDAMTGQSGTMFSITIAIIDDNVDDLANIESYAIELRDATSHGVVATTTGTIVDDENIPTLTIVDNVPGHVASASGIEGGQICVSLRLDHPSEAVTSVSYTTYDYSQLLPDSATAGIDYIAIGPLSQLVPIAAGLTDVMVCVDTIPDALNEEPLELFGMELSSPAGLTFASPLPDNILQTTVAVADDDGPPGVVVSGFTADEPESGTVQGFYTVMLTAPSGRRVRVNYTISGGTATKNSDYAIPAAGPTNANGAGLVIFEVGAPLVQFIPVNVLPDELEEPAETMLLEVTSVTNSVLLQAPTVPSVILANDARLDILAFTPANHSLHAPTTTNITVTFDEPVDLASLSSATIFVHGSISAEIPFTVSLSVDGLTLTIDPLNDLTVGEQVEVLLSPSISTPAGVSLTEPLLWRFTVATLNTPASFAPCPVLTQAFGIRRAQTEAIQVADLDHDGDLDIVEGVDADGVNATNGTNAIYINRGLLPDGTIDLLRVPFTTPRTNTVALVVMDIDGDDLPDLVEGNVSQPNVVYRNVGGSFVRVSTFFHPAVGNTNRVALIAVGDLNGDGFDDIVEGNRLLDNVVYLGDGSFNFTPAARFNAGADTYSMVAGDIDGDADLDIFEASFLFGSQVSICRMWENVGGTFVVRPETYNHNSATCAVFGDFDGDGDQDIAVGEQSAPNVIYKNDGTGHFTQTNIFGGTFAVAECIQHSDIDLDGDLDVVTGRMGLSGVIGGGVVYLNDGDGFFNEGAVLAGSPLKGGETQAIAIANLDGDAEGFPDIVFGSYLAQNDIVLNHGNCHFDGYYGSAAVETVAAHLVDIDRDGDLDVIECNASADNVVYINQALPDGTPNMQPEYSFSVASGVLHYGMALADVDGDGDMDVIVGDNHSVELFRNDSGAGGIALTHIPGAFSDPEPFRGAANIEVGDVNGDGYADIVVSGRIVPRSDRVPLTDGNRVYLNVVSANGPPTMGVAAFTAMSARIPGVAPGTFQSLALGDVDNDGDLDAVAGFHGGEIKTSFNNGSGLFTSNQGYEFVAHMRPYALELTDIDGDGSLDIVAGAYDAGDRRIYFNDGAGKFRRQQNLKLGQGDVFQGGSIAIAAGDLDGDGDNDLVYGNWPPTDPAPNRVYLNQRIDSNGVDTGVVSFTAIDLDAFRNALWVADVDLGDIDGDGRLDILVANAFSSARFSQNRIYMNR